MTSMTEHVRTMEQAPGEARLIGAPGQAPRAAVMSDVQIALGLAEMAPAGPASRAVIERLREHIKGCLEDADRFVVTLAKTTHRRYVVSETIRHAREIASRPIDYGDPSARLRLHAKAADHLSVYAQAYRARKAARL